jgi:hypothetical protein
MRLPSAVAGVALVGVTYRIGLLVMARTPALLAAGLTAASPVVLSYAQQARAYVFAMLFVAIAVWAALEAKQAAGRRRASWMAVLIAASIGAFWTHYTGPLVLAPLFVWILGARWLSRRARIGSAVVVVLGWLPVVPLMLDQLSRGHQQGIAGISGLTVGNLVQVLGTPFDGRSERVTAWVVLGAVALVAAVAAVVRGSRGSSPELRRLVLPLAVAPVVVVLLVTLVSDDVLISRYTAIAAPLLLLVVAAAVASAPRWAAAGLVVVAAVAAAGGSLDLHRQERFHADVRGAFRTIAESYRPGDTVVMGGHVAIGPVSIYYRDRELPEAPVFVPGLEPVFEEAVRERRRLWLVQSEPQPRRVLRSGLATFGYQPARVRRFPGVFELQLVLAVPRVARAATPRGQ